jgi:hypothetical protein
MTFSTLYELFRLTRIQGILYFPTDGAHYLLFDGGMYPWGNTNARDAVNQGALR